MNKDKFIFSAISGRISRWKMGRTQRKKIKITKKIPIVNDLQLECAIDNRAVVK